MHAEYFPVLYPLLFLFCNEFPYALRFYEFQIFQHAHAVFGAVSFIQGLQSFTGEFFAFA